MTTAPQNNDLDRAIGAVASPRTVFAGDIVNVYYQDPPADHPEYGTKLQIVVRDWEASEGREEAYVRRSRLKVATGKKAPLTKLRKGLEQHGILAGATQDTFKASQLLGLNGLFVLEDIDYGKGIVSEDVLGVEGPAPFERPADLAPYVPKTKATDDEEEEAPEAPAEISDDARTAFVNRILANGVALNEKAAKMAAMKDTEFRRDYAVAFAALVSGTLLPDLEARGLVVKEGENYRAA